MGKETKKQRYSQDIELDHSETSKSAIEHIVKMTITKGRKPTGRNPDSKAYHRITISLTKTQKEMVQESANALDMSVSAYIKKKLFEE